MRGSGEVVDQDRTADADLVTQQTGVRELGLDESWFETRSPG